MKKVGIATRLFRCDLNQILYDYTVEVRIRFKGLYMEDIVPEELWSEVSNTVEEAVNKNIPKKNKCEKAKGLSEESLKIAEERSERQGRKGKILNTEFQRIVGRDKAFLSEKCKEIEEINRMGNGNRMGNPRGF